MKKIKILSIILSAILVFGNVASAAIFSDMPTHPADAKVIENAVNNGILSGSGDMVYPDSYITRAEMASIITRACGATKEKSITKFRDVTPDAWYYTAISRAYEMGALSGSNGLMNPTGNITFQECFTVLSQVFDLVPSYTLVGAMSESDVPANHALVNNRLYDLRILTNFSDGYAVADWAKVAVAGVVEHGGWNGIYNQLTPTGYITRLQFATVMDNLFTTYIDQPGVYTALPEGNTLIRCDGVVLDGVVTNDDIYIADSVSPNGVTLNNVTINGRLVVRGCATPTIDENGGTRFGDVGITVTGHCEQVRIIRPYINLDMKSCTYTTIYSIPTTSVSATMKM